MKCNINLILNLFIILSTSFFTQTLSQNCNANYDLEGGHVPGRCVTFQECPPLLNLIRSRSITTAEIRLLQRLTCLRDNENPTICCAKTDIKELANYNHPGSPTGVKSEDDIIYPSLTLGPSRPSTIPLDRIAFPPNSSKHKNFGLLPKIEICGLPSEHADVSSDRIIGGKDAHHGSYPWMARIGYRNLETREIEFFCGATVISQKYVITAAHCTQEVDTTEYLPVVIRIGEHDADTEIDCSLHLNCSRAVDFRIAKMIPHPRYSTEDKSNDIELIRVHGNIPFDVPYVKPICLPFGEEYEIQDILKPNDNDQFVTRKGVVAGWGRTKWNRADGSRILQQVSLPIISNQECQANYSTKIRISELQMCAGGLANMDSCGGDSGGPIAVPIPMKIVQNRNSIVPSRWKLRPRFFQLGVVSFGPVQCGVGGLPGVYTRITGYKKWILDNLEP